MQDFETEIQGKAVHVRFREGFPVGRMYSVQSAGLQLGVRRIKEPTVGSVDPRPYMILCVEDAAAVHALRDRLHWAAVEAVRNEAADNNRRVTRRAASIVTPETDGCTTCQTIADEGGFGPRHGGSARCESGSIASGGKNSHCTCDTCF